MPASNPQSPLEYVSIPPCATRLRDTSSSSSSAPASSRPTPKLTTTALPRPSQAQAPTMLSSPTSATSSQGPLSPSKLAYNSIPSLLLSSTLQIPQNAPEPRRGGAKLLSARDPLSIPITTVNFRRFVAKVGPVFWLQDRVEEVVMWRKGNRYTAVWMGVYAFLCTSAERRLRNRADLGIGYFPRLVLLLPHVIVLSILLATHPSLRSNDNSEAETKPAPTTPPAQVGEGSVDYLANVQAIQNLMGVFSDFYDAVLPVVPHLTHASPYTPIILTLVLVSLLAILPLLLLLPPRPTFLFLGLFPLLCTHPFTLHTIPNILSGAQPTFNALRTRLARLIDDDRLEDRHWRATLRDVELFENERWAAPTGRAGSVMSRSVSDVGEDAVKAGLTSDAGWAKTNLKPGERKAWTRGRDGWSGVGEDGSADVSSNLTFALEPGWVFVETEDWRPDLQGSWVTPGVADKNGWVYTNDAWLDPHSIPLEEWRTTGMTRRRRWTRRIYYDQNTDAEKSV
ncbi:integral peroxisomal membrane peroxin-domain-containing protein [Rhodofomes roseus]|uniref:Integral peroxisomal membrane peroxin-domain-containing protein n=1 Tax=Rhodofomes roseus TaxID=34475 RepID=A0ABQ8KUI8_9APHY|nr:integral peroxisomal membrane peroxin-domain-containing protein [Rhodofomes roseus]KAH9841736.1 integral peroxisomal membrane peroxin-domain-containing protein [Rhodofomes roseus]